MGSGDDPWLSNDPWMSGKAQNLGSAPQAPPKRVGTPPPSDSEDSPGPAAAAPAAAARPAPSNGGHRGPASDWINSKPKVQRPSAKFPPATPQKEAQAPQAPEAPQAPRSEANFPKAAYQVPATGFPDAKGPGLGEQLPRKHWMFHVHLWKEQPSDKLGIRGELVDGFGFESACRVHKIYQEGLVQKWNEMALANEMPDWQIEIDDVIVGVNGRLDFHPDNYEVQNATNLDLLIVRDLGQWRLYLTSFLWCWQRQNPRSA